jgi:2-oxo-3-hexenedioate decarboxylase
MTDIGRLADLVLTGGGPLTPISSAEPDATLDDAYAVRDHVLARRLETGDALRGVKLGGTPPTKAGEPWDELALGWLTSSMIWASDAVFQRDEFVLPLAEPEMAFVLGEDIEGPGIGLHDVLDATVRIHGAIEVMDVRFGTGMTAVDVIADNIAASRVVVGADSIAPRDHDLSVLGCLFERDGHSVATASGAAVLGHPAAAIAALANAVAARDGALRAGWIVLAGGLVAPTDVSSAASVTAIFSQLGRVGFALR